MIFEIFNIFTQSITTFIGNPVPKICSNKNTLKNPNKTTTGFYNTNKNFSQIALNDNPIKEGNKKNFYLFFRK